MFININGAQINTTATGEDVVTVVQNTTNLNQLHDVSTNGVGNNHVLQYNSTASEWQASEHLTIDGDLTVEFIKNPTGMQFIIDGEDKLEFEDFRTIHKQRFINGSVFVNTTNDPSLDGYSTAPFGNLNSVFQHFLPDGDTYCQMQRKIINLEDHAVDEDSRVADLFVAVNRNGDQFNIGEFSCKYDSTTDRLHELQIQCESQFEGAEIVKGIMLATAKQMRLTVPTKFAQINSGTTLPGSGSDGELFFHDTGTSNIVKVWAVDAWYDFEPDTGAVFYDNNRAKMVLRTNTGYVSFDTTAL